VVAEVVEHTAGSFAVKLAPIRALFETVPRTRVRPARTAPPNPKEFKALSPATLAALRWLAERALDALGAPHTDGFIRDEMMRQLAVLTSAIAPDEKDRQARLRSLIAAASDAFDGAE
jgi:hypothetical protein